MDENGNLWMVSEACDPLNPKCLMSAAPRVFLIESGLPVSTPPPSTPPPSSPPPSTPPPSTPPPSTLPPSTPPSITAVAGGVPVAAFRNPELKGALLVRIDNILRSIAAGKIVPARQMIRTLRMRVDGCGTEADGDDWIVVCNPHQSDVRNALDNLIQ
jgi:hypothetical protein